MLEFVTEANESNRAALAAFGPAIAIDSSLGTSVAVSDGTRIITLAVDDHLSHAEVIGTLIARALDASRVTPAEITHVVAGMGPGPFTGLRVGIAAAQGFAAGRRLALLPLVSHEALALSAFIAEPDRTEAVVVTDARRKQFFVTHFSRPDAEGLPVLLTGPALHPRAEFGEASVSVDQRRIDPIRVDAARLIDLGALRLHAGRDFEPNAALYLRSPDVTPSTGPKRVSA